MHGGRVVAQGTAKQIAATKGSLTGEYLSGKRRIEVPSVRHTPATITVETGKGKNKSSIEEPLYIRLDGASGNNLKNVNLSIPIGVMTCITGVSGSGKSTLINRTLMPLAATALNNATTLVPEKYDSITGLEHLDKMVDIDQSPIGRTPRSNPATYTGVFTLIRDLFTQTPEARARGYKAGRFSFNVKGGRCESCQGDGLIKVEMHFLPDMYVPCDACHGKR